MAFSRINNYINPFSAGFSQARKDFAPLTTVKKIAVLALSIFVGLATFFLAGIGGFATFKALVDLFKVAKLPSGGASKIKEIPNVPKPPEEEKGIAGASLDELLKRSVGLLLNNPPDGQISDDSEAINDEILKRVRLMEEPELKELLNQLKDFEKFSLVAFGTAVSDRKISQSCKILEECEWPSQELKDRHLPTFLTGAILENGILWDEYKKGFIAERSGGRTSPPGEKNGFKCYRIELNIKKIFSDQVFTRSGESISPYLARSIGLAIEQTARGLLEQLQGQLNQGEALGDDPRVGVEVIIGRSPDSRLTTKMIASILPYLKTVPAMVSLTLSDNGERSYLNPCAFTDERLSDLLDILKSQPFLQKFRVNTDGMSPTNQIDFEKEKTRPFKKPSLAEFLALNP